MSRESSLLATCAGSSVHLWPVSPATATQSAQPAPASRALPITPHGNTAVNCVVWNHNNVVAVSCGDDGMIVLNHKSGKDLGKLSDSRSREPITSVSFSKGSRYLASGGRDQLVSVWDLKAKKRIQFWETHTAAVTSVLFGYKDRYVASADDLGMILLHSLSNGSYIATLRPEASNAHSIRSMAFSAHHNSWLVSGSDSGTVTVWDTTHRAHVANFKNSHFSAATGVDVSRSNARVAFSCSQDKTVHLYDTNAKKCVRMIATPSPLSCMSVHSNGTDLCVGSVDGNVLFYDLRYTGRFTHSFQPSGTDPVRCVRFETAEGRDNGLGVRDDILNPIARTSSGGDLGTPVKQLKSAAKPSILDQSIALSPYQPPKHQTRNNNNNNNKNGTTAGHMSFGLQKFDASVSQIETNTQPRRRPPQKAPPTQFHKLPPKPTIDSPSRPRVKTTHQPPQPPPQPTAAQTAQQPLQRQDFTLTRSPPPKQSAVRAAEEHKPSIHSNANSDDKLGSLVRCAVKDAMSECFEQTNDRIHRLHFDMLKQFSTHLADMDKRFDELRGEMASLRQDNQRLRDENAALKHVF